MGSRGIGSIQSFLWRVNHKSHSIAMKRGRQGQTLPRRLRTRVASIDLPCLRQSIYISRFAAMDSREALVALNMVEGVGPIRVRQLLEQFGDAASILKASRSQLAAVRGIGEDTAD